MKSLLMAIALLMLPVLSIAADNGLKTVPSSYSVAETINRLETLVKEKNITVFARIDHQAEAAKAGLIMKASQLLIFGNPKAGTTLMKVAPTTGIDLPLKALAWEDADGKVWLSYNRPDFLKQRHGLSDDQLKPLVPLGGLIEKSAK
ncbi:MAG: DUF302 domain-containing protein [Desulfuromonadaceae bacterium]|nr:DUF302 domain-containing protein [Desulfuromonadaceae bacterium]